MEPRNSPIPLTPIGVKQQKETIMMKKTYKSSLLALSVLASFTSCSESESLQQANLSKDKITFHATLDNSWKPMSPASSSRAAIAAATEKGPIVVPTPFGKPLYLHSVVQETADLQQAAATTRGAMHTGNTLDGYNGFGVTAIYNNGTLLFPADKKATELTEQDDQGKNYWGFADDSDAKWPGDAEVTFLAYAPHSSLANNMLAISAEEEDRKKGVTKITYTAASATADDIQNQPDLIVATNTGSQADAAVNLKFSHALTAVSFALSSDLVGVIGNGYQLEEIKLAGVPYKGVCELKTTSGKPDVPSCVWTLTEGEKCDYTFDLTQKNIIISNDLEDMALTDANQTLMMIPQTLIGAQLTFTFKLNNHTQKFEIQMPEQTWEAGKSVVYKLSANAINTISHTNVVYHDLDTWKAVSYPKSTFENNDEIGLCVVGQGNKVVTPNMKLKLTDGTWKTEDGKKFLMRADYKYFAYYPYDANITENMLEANATTAAGFFAKAIENRPLVEDQSDKQKLESADFQVAMGEPIGADASTMTFLMSRQGVGLAVLTLGDREIENTRQFTDDSYMYYYGEGNTAPTNYTVMGEKLTLTASNKFVGNHPYHISDTKKYLQIIPFGKTVSFKADSQDEKYRTAWGNFSKYSLTVPNNTTPLQGEEIKVEADFNSLAHLFSYDTRYNPAVNYGGGVTDFIQQFKVPEGATYTLECWGADSRGHRNLGGHNDGGGYSKGDAIRSKEEILYVCVGGEGNQDGSPNVGGWGGYNGGAYGRNGYNRNYWGGCGGGGATHIGLKKELLTGFASDFETQLLIVAGGRGGDYYKAAGGFGGGESGGTNWNIGGSHTVISNVNNKEWWYQFGAGWAGVQANSGYYNRNGNGGGGGGFWGGYSTQINGSKNESSGSGGTGYVNKNLLKEGAATIAGNIMFESPTGGQETGHKGHGAAKISWAPQKATRN